MPRKPNKNGTERLYVRISSENLRYLEELANVGIHGVTPSEVAKTFIGNEIERMVIKEKFLNRRAKAKRKTEKGGSR